MGDRWEAGLMTMQEREHTRSPARNAFYDDVMDQAFELFTLPGNVLDVGCGSGHAARRLPGMYTGVDPCAQDDGPHGHFRRGVAEELPFPDATFDSVLCYSVLQHVMDPEKVLEEICRVLVPGGRVGILVCVDSEDKVFLHHWTRDGALEMLVRHFTMERVMTMPGMYAPDGQFLIVSGVKR